MDGFLHFDDLMLGYLFYLDTKQNHAKPMIKHLNILKVEGMFQRTHSFYDFDPRILPGSKIGAADTGSFAPMKLVLPAPCVTMMPFAPL